MTTSKQRTNLEGHGSKIDGAKDKMIKGQANLTILDNCIEISLFLNYVKNESQNYITNNVIVTMGGDFTYQDAAMWYTNLDKLIKYSNLKAAKEGMNINVFYSTPTCYLKAVKNANPILPTKKDDFFPYASDPTAYWTGYFTSRPTTKFFERDANNVLQMVKQLQVLADLDKHNEFVLDELKSAMGIMQHHDAITGTEKQHVTHDYERILSQAVDDAMIIARQAVNKIAQQSNNQAPVLGVNRCRLNESSCDVSENSNKFVITIYNPLAWEVKTPVSIPVTDGSFDVFGPDGKQVEHAMYNIPDAVKSIPTRRSSATQEIVFVTTLKPVSYKSFYIQKHSRSKRDENNINYYKINEYWKDIKDNMIDIKDLSFDANDESKVIDKEPTKINQETKRDTDDGIEANDKYETSYETPVYKTIPENYELNDRIPLEPIPYVPTEYKKFNVDVLKSRNGGNLRDLEEFLNENDKRENRDSRRMGIGYPELSDDEMRMLGDDPMIVQRYDDEPMVNDKRRYEMTSNNIKDTTNVEGLSLNISMYYYTGSTGNNENYTQRSSGAYIFRPREITPKKLVEIQRKSVINDVFREHQITLAENAYFSTRMYNNMNDAIVFYIDWVVGPINIDDNIGKEYIIKYETNLINNGEFYTDSNGRQMLKRKLNYRPQWNVTLEEPVAGNYYPVTNEIYIKNDVNKVVVVTDRSQGGTSLVEGEIELMLHRRLLCDDAFGVGEALNETALKLGLVVRGQHKLLITVPNAGDTRKQVLETQLPPNVLFSDAKDISIDVWKALVNEFSFTNELPKGVHILTLEPWDEKLLLRVENYLEGDSANLVVDLTKILKHINIKGVKEVVLSANQWLNDHEKMVWTTENDFGDDLNVDNDAFDVTNVRLSANQIRTFVIDYEVKSDYRI